MKNTKPKKRKNWMIIQREQAEKVISPTMFYDEKYDILNIFWFPHLDYEVSVETEKGFIFDISKKPEQEVKGVEIHDFMKKLKETKKKK